MRVRFLTSAAIALSLVATPALANPAAGLSVANSPQVRGASKLDGASKLQNGLGVIMALAVGAGAVVLALTVGDDDGDERPDSN